MFLTTILRSNRTRRAMWIIMGLIYEPDNLLGCANAQMRTEQSLFRD